MLEKVKNRADWKYDRLTKSDYQRLKILGFMFLPISSHIYVLIRRVQMDYVHSRHANCGLIMSFANTVLRSFGTAIFAQCNCLLQCCGMNT
jgi:hypothetical protein